MAVLLYEELHNVLKKPTISKSIPLRSFKKIFPVITDPHAS